MSVGAWSLHGATSYASGGWPPAVAAPERHAAVPLPERRPLAVTLDDLLARRASCRRFSGAELALDAVSSLLAAAYGEGPEVSVEGASFPSRPVPSAGATYPLQLHVLVRAVDGLAPGSYHYLPGDHALAPTGPGVPFAALAEIFLGQPYLTPAAAVLVLAGALDQTTARYGDRGYRYVLYEAGHTMQNVILTGAALDVGSLNLGGFLDDALAAVLRLRPDAVPLYGVALGPPAGDDRDELRRIG
jgi:SagB-type dehydrogenase family enzyme